MITKLCEQTIWKSLFHSWGLILISVFSFFQLLTQLTMLLHQPISLDRWKKTESPQNISANIELTGRSLSGKCSVAGINGYCHKIIALFFHLSYCKQLGLKSLLDDLTGTSMKQRRSTPREENIEQKQIQDILDKKPKMVANYSKLYCCLEDLLEPRIGIQRQVLSPISC